MMVIVLYVYKTGPSWGEGGPISCIILCDSNGCGTQYDVDHILNLYMAHPIVEGDIHSLC